MDVERASAWPSAQNLYEKDPLDAEVRHNGTRPREVELGRDEKPLHEDLPATGCNVELTLVEVSGEIWWTFGFECFGELGLVDQQLRAVAASLAAREPPDMGNPVPASYPAWLSDSTNTGPASP
ncbi:hypothetical protein [Mesorhizobium sp. WSM2561]|uniref:hypothetical protein n=1 Tax=Mesorhizobium sp. WSM2561 TaxID=1040985 RepID=UPI0012EC147C|nr:hypothetical protein [Mesorhizobium sp. WSM2561]